MARALGTAILLKCGEVNHRVDLESYDRFFPNQEYLPKQWALLSKVRRLSLPELRRLIDQFLPKRAEKPDADEDASLAKDLGALESVSDVSGILPSGTAITVSRGAQISIPLEGLPSKLVKKLKRCASFPNPKYYTLQRMRMETYPERRFLFSGELRVDELMLPRGVLEKATEILSSGAVMPQASGITSFKHC